jgi:IclR family transcriptional regulator, pca regulon regulatory protein
VIAIEKVPEPGGQYIQSFARGLSVIRAFSAESPKMTLSELAARTHLTRATARRFLHTLVELGYVGTDGKLFELTPRVLELGFSYLSGLTLPELAQPYLESLSRSVNESTSASVLDRQEIVYIARVPTRRIMNVGITIGTRFPAHATSMGRVLLSALDESNLNRYLARMSATPLTERTITSPDTLREILAKVRNQGWALVDQELENGLRAIAAPVRKADGTVVAAINVSTTSANSTLERIESEFRPALLDTAAEISRAINSLG